MLAARRRRALVPANASSRRTTQASSRSAGKLIVVLDLRAIRDLLLLMRLLMGLARARHYVAACSTGVPAVAT